MSQLNIDYQDGHWGDITGYLCSWCGRKTELRYIFPIVYHIGEEQQIVAVCFECIAKSPTNGPDAFNNDLPIYDMMGNRKVK